MYIKIIKKIAINLRVGGIKGVGRKTWEEVKGGEGRGQGCNYIKSM